MDKVTKNPWTAKVASVSSDGTTVKVEVPRIVQNGLYGKRLVRKTVILADSAGKTVKVGDSVQIVPCRRISRLKNWMVL